MDALRLSRFAQVGNENNALAALIDKAQAVSCCDAGVNRRIKAGSSLAFEHLVLILGAEQRSILIMPRSPSQPVIYDRQREGRSLAARSGMSLRNRPTRSLRGWPPSLGRAGRSIQLAL